MQEGLTLPQNNETEQLTPGVWLFSQIPEGEDRLDANIPLILPKRYYQRFVAMLQGDEGLAKEIFSSLLCDKLEQWAGESSDEPEITAVLVQAAINKNMPLNQEVRA